MNANQVLFQWLCVECICLGGVSMFCTMNRRVSNMFGVFDTSVKDASSVIVYYKMGDSFGEYKNDQHKVVSVENVTGRGIFRDIDFMIDFLAINACDTESSSVDFCDNSRLWHNMLIIVGNTQSGKICRIYKKNEHSNYRHDYTHEFRSYDDSQILPDLKTRMHAIMLSVFYQLIGPEHNKLLNFTGATFNPANDCLYFSATLVHDHPEWNLGKHVLFRASFANMGVLQNAEFVAKFEEPFIGLVYHNAKLYALTVNQDILELNGDGKILNKIPLNHFFGCDKSTSPLKHKGSKLNPNRLHGEQFAIKDTILFPFYPRKISLINSSLLTGGTFIVILVVLILLLIIVVAIDAFILFNMNKHSHYTSKRVHIKIHETTKESKIPPVESVHSITSNSIAGGVNLEHSHSKSTN